MKLLNTITEVSLILLVLLFPVVALPAVAGLPAYGRVAILLVFSVWLLALWAIKALVEKKIYLPHSPFTKPCLFLLVAVVVSSASSSTPVIAILGTLPTLFPSLLGWCSLLAIFWLVGALANEKMGLRVRSALLLSITITSVAAVLACLPLNFFDWGQSAKTVGVVAALGAVLAVTLLPEVKNLGETILSALALAVCLSVALAFFSLPVVLVLVGSAVSLAASDFEWRKLGERKYYLIPVLMLAGAVCLVSSNSTLQSLLGLKISPPKELTLDLKTSWSVTALILRDRPFFGSGPGAFATQFTKYLPGEFIQGPYWALRFDRPGSEFLQILATSGILGFLALIFLTWKLIASVVQSRGAEKHLTQITTMALAAGLLAALLVYPANILLVGLLILFLALVKNPKAEAIPLKGQFVYLGSIVLGMDVVLAVIVGYGLLRAGRAEVLERKGIEAYQKGEITSALDSFDKAKTANPYFDRYLINHAVAETNAALALGAKPDATEEEKRLALQFIQQAVNSTQQALALNPENAYFWEILARIYQPLIGSVKDADRFAVDAYQKARSFAPTDPDLALRFGQMFYQYRNLNQALTLFVEAARLRPMHANVRFNLGVTLKELGSYNEALGELEVVTRLLPQDSQDLPAVNQQLEEVRKLLAEAESKKKEAEGAPSSTVPLSTQSQPKITLPGEATSGAELK